MHNHLPSYSLLNVIIDMNHYTWLVFAVLTCIDYLYLGAFRHHVVNLFTKEGHSSSL